MFTGSNPTSESHQALSSEKNENTLQPDAIRGDKDQVNMALSGKLLEETNTINGVVVKYSEPPEARKPKTRWRLYVFKGNEELPILYIHRQSAYLLGRDRKVRINCWQSPRIRCVDLLPPSKADLSGR